MPEEENITLNNSIKELYFTPDGKDTFFTIVHENLFEGQELKNFKSLCSILEIEPCPKGNARIRHMTAWKCFFDFEYLPETYRIRINKIYSYNEIKEYISPLSGGEIRTEENQEFHFYNYIIPLLEDYSARNGHLYTYDFSNTEIITILGLMNSSYNDFIEKIRYLCRTNEKKEDNIEYFELYNVFTRLLISDLLPAQTKVLKNRNILIDKHDVYFVTKKNRTMRATERQTKVILDIKNTISQSKEDLFNGTHPLSILIANDTLTNHRLKELGYDFEINYLKKEYIFSKDKFRPHRLDDEVADIYRHKINDYFLEHKLIKKLKEIELTGRYNIMNRKYMNLTTEELKNRIIQLGINYCKI